MKRELLTIYLMSTLFFTSQVFAVTDLYIGQVNGGAGSPALTHMTYDKSAPAGSRYNFVESAVVDYNITHIAVNPKQLPSRGIYLSVSDTDPCSRSGNKYLREYALNGVSHTFTLLRQQWNNVDDLAIDYQADQLYFFDKGYGTCYAYVDSNWPQVLKSRTWGYDPCVPTSYTGGKIAITDDRKIVIATSNLYKDTNLTLPDYLQVQAIDANAVNFARPDLYDPNFQFNTSYKSQPFLAISPINNNIINVDDSNMLAPGLWGRYLLTSHAWGWHGTATPESSPATRSLGLRLDKINVPAAWGHAVVVRGMGVLSDGKIVYLVSDFNSLNPSKHASLVVLANDFNSVSRDACYWMKPKVIANVGPSEPNLMMVIDEQDTIHVFNGDSNNDGMEDVLAWEYNASANTLTAVDARYNIGKITAAHVVKKKILIGDTSDVYRDINWFQNPFNNWKFLAPNGNKLTTNRSPQGSLVLAPMCECGNPNISKFSWFEYDVAPSNGGPYKQVAPYVNLPWLGRGGCQGSDGGEALVYGPLLIRWTAPYDVNNVEIRGHLWQTDTFSYYPPSQSYTTHPDRRQAYKIIIDPLKAGDPNIILESGAVQVNGSGNTLPLKQNMVKFGAGNPIVIASLKQGDVIDLWINSSTWSGSGADASSWFAYLQYQITIPKCYFTIPGDLNHDCVVDFLDLHLMADQWLMPDVQDLDGNPAIVNFGDYAYLALDWLIDCRSDPLNSKCTPNP